MTTKLDWEELAPWLVVAGLLVILVFVFSTGYFLGKYSTREALAVEMLEILKQHQVEIPTPNWTF